MTTSQILLILLWFVPTYITERIVKFQLVIRNLKDDIFKDHLDSIQWSLWVVDHRGSQNAQKVFRVA